MVGGVLWCGVGVLQVLCVGVFYGVGVCFVLVLWDFVLYVFVYVVGCGWFWIW